MVVLIARHTQTLVVPAVISLVIFAIFTFALVPLWTRYRSRYSQYIPVERISNHTLSLRGRIQGAIGRWVAPSYFSRDGVLVGDASDAGFSSDDGEELDNVLDDDDYPRGVLSMHHRAHQDDSNRRLSREYV